MVTRFRLHGLVVLLTTALVGNLAFAAEQQGQSDLDKATETKLAAASIDDLSEVVRLTESAMKKGLDPANTEFAKRLLGSTLIERARATVKEIFTNVSSADTFRQQRQSAVSDLEKALKLDAKQPQAYLLLAQLNLLPGGTGVKEVVASLDKAIELSVNDPPTRAKALVLRASLQEQPDKKRADLDEAVRLMPDDAATVRARGLALADMGKPELALADLNKAIELDPRNEPTYEAKAIVLARLKKYDKAIAALDKARELSPESLAPLVQKARVHSEQRKFDAALDDLKEALALDPGNIGVLVLRAGVYEEKGDKKQALADLDEALKLRPDVPLLIRTRAMFLAQNDRLDEAIADLEKLVQREPKDAATQLQLGMMYSAKKNWPKAFEIYTAVLKIEPANELAFRGRADAYLNSGHQAEAIADYEKALKLQPKDESVLNNFAWVLATSPNDKLRNGRRAIELATEACKLTEYKAAFILSTLAAAYAETGDFDAAVKWATKAIELADKPDANENDKESRDALKKELEHYKAKKPTRELLSEGKSEEKKP